MNRSNDRGAELLYGDRKRLSGIKALEESRASSIARREEGNHLGQESSSTRSLSVQEKTRLKERYSMEYSRYLVANARGVLPWMISL